MNQRFTCLSAISLSKREKRLSILTQINVHVHVHSNLSQTPTAVFGRFWQVWYHTWWKRCWILLDLLSKAQGVGDGFCVSRNTQGSLSAVTGLGKIYQVLDYAWFCQVWFCSCAGHPMCIAYRPIHIINPNSNVILLESVRFDTVTYTYMYL